VESTGFTSAAGSDPRHRGRLHRRADHQVGAATNLAADPSSLPGPAPVITATGIPGRNTATWDPTVHVLLPSGTLAGVYSATITHSVA